MTNGKKVGGLVLLLAIPVFILVFLEQFGQQHYEVPTDPAEAEGLSAEMPVGSLGTEVQWPRRLMNGRGEALSTSTLTGEIIVFPLEDVDSDTSQVVLEKLTRVQNVFEQEESVQILVIVRTQTLSVLSSLAQRYRSQEARWKFLADTTPAPSIRTTLPPGTSSSTLLLIDQDQKIRGYYNGMQEDEIDRLVVETRILLYGVK